jgi:hypothetical protein
VDRDTEDFLVKYLKELNDNNAAVFVGAGLSRTAGYDSVHPDSLLEAFRRKPLEGCDPAKVLKAVIRA